jgi:hypothetical protein
MSRRRVTGRSHPDDPYVHDERAALAVFDAMQAAREGSR